ncbi:MAG TPA: pilus assembly protein PilV [Methylophilaceae bacterium]|nr:pilus assembly protein PilV [Methylophilaceae bacterium]
MLSKPMQAGNQQGSVLLEALIAILIFSMGILAIVGLQAAAIKTVSDSQYRLEASFLANRLVAQMWTDKSNITNYAIPGASATNAADWLDDVETALPGAADHAPTVSISGNATDGYTVTMQINWQPAGENSPHNFKTIAYINTN